MRIPFRKFDKGLHLTTASDEGPENSLRRARGIHGAKTNSIRSRLGNVHHLSLNAHSLGSLDDVVFSGVSGALYRGYASLMSGLTGSQWCMINMPPCSGIEDYLFLSGAGTLYKVSKLGDITLWGIEPPDYGTMAAALATGLYKTIDTMDDDATLGTSYNEVDERWVVAAGAGVLSEEGTIVIQGTSSMKLVVALDTGVAVHYKYMTVNGSALDLTAFSTGEESTEADYISFWVRVSNPTNVNYMEIVFSLGNENFTSDVYNMRIAFADAIPGVSGLGDIRQFNTAQQEQEALLDYYGFAGMGRAIIKQYEVLHAFSAVAIAKSADIWQQVRIAKKLFSRTLNSGNGYDWADVQAVAFQVFTFASGGTDVYFDDLRLTGGAGMQGNYRYHVTFRNSTTGTRSNSDTNSILIEDVIRQAVTLTNIPVSTDPQVDQREIWRTVGSGTLFFKCYTIDDNTTTTWTDEVADLALLDVREGRDLLDMTQVLPTDNTRPFDHFKDCAYYNASAFWITKSGGKRGHVYYSPIGRMEANQGFIIVTNDDDPLQRLVAMGNQLFAVSKEGWFSIEGTNPYISRRILGVPGTSKPGTVALVSKGIMYEAPDGVRILDGSASMLISTPIDRIFKGEAVENLSAMNSLCACRGPNDEYYIGSAAQTLAVSLLDGTWRDLGFGSKALYYDATMGIVYGSVNGDISMLEVEGIRTESPSGIPFEVETNHARLDAKDKLLVNGLAVDIDTGGLSVTITFLHDGVETSLGGVSTNSRSTVYIPLGVYAWVVGVRFTATITVPVELYGLELHVNTPDHFRSIYEPR